MCITTKPMQQARARQIFSVLRTGRLRFIKLIMQAGPARLV